MIVAKSEHVICFDVDDTLIFWDEQSHKGPAPGYISIQCPHDCAVTYHRVHERHVGFLKKQATKGLTVVVWSASGTGWAKVVVQALGIEKYVDIVMSKPSKYVDDLVDPGKVLVNHIYLNPEGHSV